MFQLERNYLYHAALHALGRRSARHPLGAYVYLTYRCNLDCIYCYDGTSGSYPKKSIDRELDAEDWIALFRMLRSEMDSIVLTGGEPTVRPDIVEIARQLQSMRYRIVSLLTNGLNLDGRQELLDCVDMFLVSLDSLDTERAARMLGRKGALEKIVENVTAAAKLQEEKRFKIYVVICVTRENIPDAHGVIDFALERNIGVTISPEVRGWVPAEGLKGNAQYEAFVDRIIALKRSGADVLGSIPFFQGVRAFDQFDCDPTLLCRVKPNGDLIYPCNRQGAEGINLLTLGSYEKALAVAEEKCGRIGKCPHSCHEGCYLDFSAMVQQPWRLFQEAWIQGVLRPLRRGRGP